MTPGSNRVGKSACPIFLICSVAFHDQVLLSSKVLVLKSLTRLGSCFIGCHSESTLSMCDRLD